VAEQEGLSQEERERAQSFESEDESRASALRFAKEILENDAHISEEAFEDVREAGYSDEQIMEMISNVALTTFSNFMNDAIGTEVDVPQVDPVQS
jgi:alkylhydroperoxidase family enzyme